MTRRLHLWLAIASMWASGCGLKLPEDYPLASYTRGTLLGEKDKEGRLVEEAISLSDQSKEKLHEVLNDTYFPPPWTWNESSMAAAHFRVRRGQELYQQHCIHCHGVAGAGDGPTSAFLFPRPRDYRRGTFKWKSTERTARPTRGDLLAFLKEGAVGTSMPSFALFAEQDLEDLVDYVIYLAKRGEAERKIVIEISNNEGTMPDAAAIGQMVADVEASWSQAESKVIKPDASMPVYSANSDEYEESVKRGRQIYLSAKAQCVKCHGDDGKADPNKMAEAEKKQLFDDWGVTNYPRNLTLGLFRGGRRPIDLFRRVHQGIAGSAMPAGGTNLKAHEIWDVVNFVRALPHRQNLLAGAQATGTAPAAANAPPPSHGN